MIELPEAQVLANQIKESLKGKVIKGVTAAHTPHKLAWYYGDRSAYADLLINGTIEAATGYGGLIEMEIGNARILIGEGVNLRYHDVGAPRPARHQLLLDFSDGSALSAVVQMYGGMGAYREGDLDNHYYKVAKERPSPLTKRFDFDHFNAIANEPDARKISLKALLATEQRIPGLGNGVLQDILFNAKMHPKKKVNSLDEHDLHILFNATVSTLKSMTEMGGRDTEVDLYGREGSYRTILSKKTIDFPCPMCGMKIRKEAYLGGSVYYCGTCQRI